MTTRTAQTPIGNSKKNVNAWQPFPACRPGCKLSGVLFLSQKEFWHILIAPAANLQPPEFPLLTLTAGTFPLKIYLIIQHRNDACLVVIDHLALERVKILVVQVQAIAEVLDVQR